MRLKKTPYVGAFFGLICFSLAVCPVSGVPAPSPPIPWSTGWDQPVNPLGDCVFERKGEDLSIFVPGTDHMFNLNDGPLTAPRLLRKVQGDFIVYVRVGGKFSPSGCTGYHSAGLLLTDGQLSLKVQRVVVPECVCRPDNIPIPPLCVDISVKDGYRWKFFSDEPRLGKPCHLRLERHGLRVRVDVSENGKDWTRLTAPFDWLDNLRFRPPLKIGVVAEATAPGQFKPCFDHLHLTRLPGSRH
jgi:regulation of enolase protein 1 (concanavalin A-like superfamily)